MNGKAVQFGAAETITIVIAENNNKLSVQSVTNSSGHTVWDAENLVANTTITNSIPTTEVSASKIWENADGSDTPPTGAKVTFTLYQDGNQTDKTVELDGTVDETGETDAWVATFSGLQKYKVVNEEAVEIVYTIFEENSGKWTGYDRVETKPVNNGETITNKQQTKWVQFKKTDMSGTALSDAVFSFNDGKQSLTLTSGTDGIMSTSGTEIKNKFQLPVSTSVKYILSETTAPDGYLKLTDDVNVSVTTAGVSAKLGDTTTQYTVTGTGTETDPFVVVITNSAGSELPMTGGTGTLPYTLGGITVMLTALMYGFRMRRRERRLN